VLLGLIGSGCETIKEICDFDCGRYTEGEVSISGNPQVDGFFKALNNVELAVAAIQGQFEADVLAIAEAFGVEEGAVNSAYISKVKAAVDAEYQAKLVGGAPQVIYQKPRCEASLDVAVKASAECRVKGGCQVDIECSGGELTMTCEGVCRGSCSGQCTVPRCEIELDVDGGCSAECHGACEAQVNAKCEGICRGTCSGDCSAYNGMAECMGYCDGTCNGTCEASVTGSCSGVCRGQCWVSGSAAASCEGKLGCEGSCEGECTGSCEGRIEAPRCSTDAQCDIEAKCDAQASIQASADLHEIRYVFKAGVDDKGKAEFFARLAVLEERMASIAQGHAKFYIFLEGDTSLDIEPVLPLMLTEFTNLLSAVNSGEIEINIVRLACVAPAVQEAISILTALPGQLGSTFSGQLTMMGVIGQ
jgi:hypothetical protein